MKKILTWSAPLILIILGAILLSHLQMVSAQILTNTNDPNGLGPLTDLTRKSANIGTVKVGDVVATVVRTALGNQQPVTLVQMDDIKAGVVAALRLLSPE